MLSERALSQPDMVQSYEDSVRDGYQQGEETTSNAAVELAIQGMPITAVPRIINRQILKYKTADEQKLDPEVLNQKYPGLEEKFTEPTNDTVAKSIYDYQTKRKLLEERVAAGPQDGLYGLWNKWGTGLAAGAMDPVFLGMSAVTSGIAAGVLSKTALGTKLGYGAGEAVLKQTAEGLVANTVKSNIGQDFLRHSIEGFAGNLAAEPILYFADKQDQIDYKLQDGLVSAAGTAAGFSLLHGVIRGTKRLINGPSERWIDRSEPHVKQTVDAVALSQAIEGKKLNVGPVLAEYLNRTNVPNERFVKLSPEQIPETTIYFPKNEVTGDINAPSSVMSDHWFPGGIDGTDRAEVANGASNGAILSGKLHPDSKVIDIDGDFLSPNHPFLESVYDSIKSLRNEVMDKDSFIMNKPEWDFHSGKQIMDNIHTAIEEGHLPKEFFTNLKTELRAKGVDALSFTTDKLGGQDHSPHNSVILLEPSKFIKSENLLTDRDIVPQMSPIEARELFEKSQSIESSQHYDQTSFEKFEKMAKEPELPPKLADYKKELEDIHSNLDQTLKQLGEDSPEAKEILALKEDLAMDVQKDNFIKDAIKLASKCLGGF